MRKKAPADADAGGIGGSGIARTAYALHHGPAAGGAAGVRHHLKPLGPQHTMLGFIISLLFENCAKIGMFAKPFVEFKNPIPGYAVASNKYEFKRVIRQEMAAGSVRNRNPL